MSTPHKLPSKWPDGPQKYCATWESWCKNNLHGVPGKITVGKSRHIKYLAYFDELGRLYHYKVVQAINL